MEVQKCLLCEVLRSVIVPCMCCILQGMQSTLCITIYGTSPSLSCCKRLKAEQVPGREAS